MISDLDKVIRKVLVEELEIKNGEITISFDQPKREWSARLGGATVNFFLYDIRENLHLRQHPWEMEPYSSNGNRSKAVKKRPPLRYDCFYMMTAWVPNFPEDEHKLLSDCMRALCRHPVLPKKFYDETDLLDEYNIRTRLANHDVLTNPAEVWGALDNEMRPCISYVLTMALDPEQEEERPMVRNYRVSVGQADALPVQQVHKANTVATELNYIVGYVHEKADESKPCKGISVAIKGTGLVATTNKDGLFKLGDVPIGEHTLMAWPDKGKPVERKIIVPAEEGENYDITL